MLTSKYRLKKKRRRQKQKLPESIPYFTSLIPVANEITDGNYPTSQVIKKPF